MAFEAYLSSSFDQHASAPRFRLVELDDDMAEVVAKMLAGTADSLDNALVLKAPNTAAPVALCARRRSVGLRRIEFSNTLLLMCRLSDGLVAESPCGLILHGDAAGDLTPAGEALHLVVERLAHQYESHPLRPRAELALERLRMCRPLTEAEMSSSATTSKRAREPTESEEEDEVFGNGTHASRRRHPVVSEDEELYTYNQLLALTPCAHEELVPVLRRAGAVVFRGRVRLLQRELLAACLTEVLRILEMSDDTATWADIVPQLSPVPFPAVALGVVRAQYFTDAALAAPPDSTSSAVACFDQERLLLGIAGLVLAPRGGAGMPLALMLQEWRCRVPGFLRASLPSVATETDAVFEAHLRKLLRGHAIVQPEGPGSSQLMATWCPHVELPHGLTERARVLFRRGPARWTRDELEPFVTPIIEPGMDVDRTLAKVCREHRVPGEPVAYTLIPLS